MTDISLTALLEAGCHFGHRAERWHPKASQFIFQTREGIHIIDLVKTRAGLLSAMEYIKQCAQEGKVLLFVATKRQAKGVVAEAAKRAGLPYMTNRWIGGMLTNWEQVKKNIDKVNTMRQEQKNGDWKKFPKHEMIKLEKDLRKLELVYGGVATLTSLPDAVIIIDVRKEDTCIKEAQSKNIPIVAIVDTNADPTPIHYAIPANDDAVGSVEFLVNALASAYIEGKEVGQKKGAGKEKDEKPKEEKAETKPKKAPKKPAKKKASTS